MGQTLTTQPSMQRSLGAPKEELQDFLLLYTPTAGDKNLFEALHALYYLPENYKLIVMAGDSARSNEAKAWLSDSAMMSRVSFEAKTGLSDGASPFSFANAIISDSSNAIVVTEDVHESILSNDRDIYAVPSDSPEALASAVLKLAKRILAPSEIQHYA